MKRLTAFVGLFFALSFSLPCSTGMSSSKEKELTAIISELKTLTEEQETIIESSKKENEELKTLLQSQEQKLNKLESLSKDKTQTIQKQKEIIEEQENLLKEPKKSSTLIQIISHIVSVVVAFFGGVFVCKLFI